MPFRCAKFKLKTKFGTMGSPSTLIKLNSKPDLCNTILEIRHLPYLLHHLEVFTRKKLVTRLELIGWTWPGCNCYATISALFWSIPKYLQSLKHTQNSFKSLRFNKHSNIPMPVHSNGDGTAPVPFKLDWFGGKNRSWISFNNHGACGCFNDKNCGEATITFVRLHGKESEGGSSQRKHIHMN